MMLAAMAGHAEIVRMLIGAGADIHARNADGCVLLQTRHRIGER